MCRPQQPQQPENITEQPEETIVDHIDETPEVVPIVTPPLTDHETTLDSNISNDDVYIQTENVNNNNYDESNIDSVAPDSVTESINDTATNVSDVIKSKAFNGNILSGLSGLVAAGVGAGGLIHSSIKQLKDDEKDEDDEKEDDDKK